MEEQTIRHVAEQPDRARVEVKETANGRTQISVRMTGNDPAKLTQDVLALYWSTRDQLDEGGIG